MKKVLKLVTCIMLIFTLCGCQKSDYEGKYKLDSIIVGDKVYKQDDTGWETILGANIDGENIYIRLKDNGSFSYINIINEKKGTWTIENDIIHMVADGFEEKAIYKDGSLLFETENNVSLLFLR